MSSPDISLLSLGFCFLLLFVPLLISRAIRLEISRKTLVSVARMAVQLVFVGIFLTFVFDLNSWLLNLLWVLGMVGIAASTTLKNIELKAGRLLLPVLLSFALANLSVLFYFNEFVLRLDSFLEARYLIPIGGMILGNSLRGNVIGLGEFYTDIRRNENRYLYALSLGAGKYEALLPYIRKCLHSALRPTLANIATVGLVFLPGMMTGQIIGGAAPMIAIKYQISIMIIIYVSTAMSTTFCIFSTIKVAFDEYGLVKKEIYKENKNETRNEKRNEKREDRPEAPALTPPALCHHKNSAGKP